MVYTTNKLSVLCGVWSPNGQKFAIGTSCRSVYVGYYDKQQVLWSTRHMKLKKDL